MPFHIPAASNEGESFEGVQIARKEDFNVYIPGIGLDGRPLVFVDIVDRIKIS